MFAYNDLQSSSDTLLRNLRWAWQITVRSLRYFTLRVQVPNNWVLVFGVMVAIVEVLGKYIVLWALGPVGLWGSEVSP